MQLCRRGIDSRGRGSVTLFPTTAAQAVGKNGGEGNFVARQHVSPLAQPGSDVITLDAAIEVIFHSMAKSDIYSVEQLSKFSPYIQN